MTKTHPPHKPVHILWFKRDLRLTDHKPLASALLQGPVLALYVVEPAYWQLQDTAPRQYAFIRECVAELAHEMALHGASLTIRVGAVPGVLEALQQSHGIAALWSHEETGNAWTYDRDRTVTAWCDTHHIPWHEMPQNGVTRGLLDRDQWAHRHGRFMAEPALPRPHELETIEAPSDALPTAQDLCLPADPCPGRQQGGRTAALDLLTSFYAGRGKTYTFDMSSPLSAETACSRLSPHLAAGTLSIREALQSAQKRREHLVQQPPHLRTIELRSLDSFISRLHWHCHFIQKLESEPEIETRAMHQAYEAHRKFTAADDPVLMAFATGQTGFPFVDACMRSLSATGWINFRMRAMLVAFATYHLNLDWHAVGLVLARLFTDYEPGIHWPQVQMQAGQTGINTPRIYNPVKQSIDQDPNGIFIRRWLPELASLPTPFLHEPWQLTTADQQMLHFILGSDYPHRLVDHVTAMRQARERFTTVRLAQGFRVHAEHVYRKHGSRNRPLNNDNPKKPKAQSKQLTLDF